VSAFTGNALQPSAATEAQPHPVLIQANVRKLELAPLLVALERGYGLQPAHLPIGLRDRLADEGMLLMQCDRPLGGVLQGPDRILAGASGRMPASQERIDINPLHPERRLATFKLAAFDMDSTLIPIECIDELAALAGQTREVAALTEAAMRGEVSDYDENLRRRTALLANLPADSLQQLIDRGIALNPGVEQLTLALRAADLRLLVLSGGFTPIVAHIAARIGAHAYEANELEVREGLLNGKLSGRILNAKYKAHYLQRYATDWSTTSNATMAFGDGANDLLMLAEAGLSIAYRAKPIVAAQADLCLRYASFDAVLEHFVETRSRTLGEALELLQTFQGKAVDGYQG
jgi:phosphoserine phosphatase